MKNRAAALALFCALAGPLAAQTIDPRLTPDEEKLASSSLHLPRGMDQAEFQVDENDEAVAQAHAAVEELEDQKTMTEFLEPQQTKVIEKQLATARLNLQIAVKRAQRNVLRKKGKKLEAAAVDREVGELKKQLKRI